MKILLLLLIGSFHFGSAMDLTPEVLASVSRHPAKPAAAANIREQIETKEKNRVTVAESSSSASYESDSSSSDKMEMLDKKIILRTLELDAKTIAILEDRLAKCEANTLAKKQSTEVSQEDKKKNRLSVVYMPPLPKLDLSQQKNDEDAEKGAHVELSDKDYELMIDHYAKETGRDLSKVKSKLVEVLKKKVETPPNTPDNVHRAQAIITYRKASMVHATARTDIETARRISPIKRTAVKNDQVIEPRAPTVAEIIEHELGGNPSDILGSIAKAADEAFNEKLTEAKNTQQKTAGGGAIGTLLGAVLSGVITYAITKSKC